MIRFSRHIPPKVPHLPLLAVLLASVVLAAPAAAVAADPADDDASGEAFAALCDRIEDGRTVRILKLDDTAVEGAFAGCRDDALLLLTDGGTVPVPFAEMAAVWTRERRTGRGAGTGALIGGGGGGLFMFLLAQLVEAVGEGDEDVDVLRVTLAGVGLGAAAGALSGAIVGSAISRWRLLLAREGAQEDARKAAPAREGPGEGRIGSLGLMLGLAWAKGANADAAGGDGDVTFTAEYPGGLSLGFEFGIANAGRQPVAWADQDDPYFSDYRIADRVWHLGILVRYAVKVGALRPYVVGGLAGYNWEDSFVGASLGGGVALPLNGRRLAARAEYRRHDNIQNLNEVDPGFGVVSAGIQYAW